jgi:hypothetical protein
VQRGDGIRGRVRGYLRVYVNTNFRGSAERWAGIPPTPTAGRTITSMKVLSGSSSRGFTSIGPETDTIAVVAPDLKVAEPSARGSRDSEAVMAMVVCGGLFSGMKCIGEELLVVGRVRF